MCFLSARFLPTQPLPTHHLSAMVLFVSFNSGAKLLLGTLHLWKNKHQDQKQHISDFLKSMNAFISPSLLSLCTRCEPHRLTTIFLVCTVGTPISFCPFIFWGVHHFNRSVYVLLLHVSSQKDAKQLYILSIHKLFSQRVIS